MVAVAAAAEGEAQVGGWTRPPADDTRHKEEGRALLAASAAQATCRRPSTNSTAVRSTPVL